MKIVILKILVYRKIFPEFIRDLIYKIITILKNRNISPPRQKVDISENLKKFTDIGYLNLAPIDNKSLKRIQQFFKGITTKEIFNKQGDKIKDLYCNSNLSENPDLLKIATNDQVLFLLSKYFGCLPKIQFMTAWKTYQNDHELGEMFFHMDHHGHKFAKLFMYLNDVDLGDGHHEFVSSSHNWIVFKKTLAKPNLINLKNQIYAKRKWKGSFWVNNEVVNRFIPDSILKISGKAGSLFLEDTRGLHRGTRIISGKPRTIFQVLFTPFDSRKDKCIKGNDLSAFQLCQKESILDKDQFADVCSLILNRVS